MLWTAGVLAGWAGGVSTPRRCVTIPTSPERA